jgi:hypothetical protein
VLALGLVQERDHIRGSAVTEGGDFDGDGRIFLAPWPAASPTRTPPQRG